MLCVVRKMPDSIIMHLQIMSRHSGHMDQDVLSVFQYSRRVDESIGIYRDVR